MKRCTKADKRIISALLTVFLLVTGLCPAAFGETKKQLDQKKDTAEKNLENAKENVSEIEEERSEAAAEVQEVDQQLVQLLAITDILDDEVAVKKVDVENSRVAYDEAEAEEKRQYKSMKNRIRFMYERGGAQYLEILMNSASFADAVNKADYIERIYDYDRELLEEYEETAREAQALYERLTEEEAELEGMQVELGEQRAELEKTLAEKRAVVENFDEKLSIARAEAKKYENQVREVNTEIAKVAAKEKAEREAREKAEREAREKAEKEKAEKAKKEKKKSESVQSSGEESQEGEYSEEQKGKASATQTEGTQSQEGEYKEETTYDESSQEGEYKKESATTEKKSSTPAVSGSGTGAEIASFACQFIGNPYVLGGTSLTDGCDCSGFTFSVFSHFGYKIPRTSSEQLSCGTGVSYSDAKAGDIVCYAGHVGLYIGNGMIVHASTPATGIKTSVATYRPILAVRRVI